MAHTKARVISSRLRLLFVYFAFWFSQSSHCLMSIWSLLVSVGLICCIGSVHSQSCFRDSDSDGGICCLRGTYSVNWSGNWSVNWFNRTCSPRGASCPCLIHSDCRSGERCNWLRSELRGVCKKRNVPYFPTYVSLVNILVSLQLPLDKDLTN